MNKKILKKFIAVLLVCIMVLNTTSTFAAFSLFNRSSSKTSSISSFFSNLFNRTSSTKEELKVKEETTVSSAPASETAEGKEILNKIDNIVESVIEQRQRLKTTGFKSFLKRIFGGSNSTKIDNPEEVLEESIVKISKVPMVSTYFEATNVEPERLATIFTSIAKDIDWANPKTIPTLIKQLATAIINTTDLTNGMITKEDLSGFVDGMMGESSGYKADIENSVTYTILQDMIRLTNYGMIAQRREGQPEYPGANDGEPISIGKVKIKGGKYGKDGREIYLVCLNGTGFTEGQQYGLLADILSGMETDSQYLQSALKAITDNIPTDPQNPTSIWIAGMSLGGMMAQQVMVQDCILANYKIEHVTIIGSPALCVDEREKQFAKYPNNAPSEDHIIRVIDQQDLVTYACVDYLTGKDYFVNNTSIPKDNIVKETLYVDNAIYHYKTGIAHHFVGYMNDKTWTKYDPLGYKLADLDTPHTVELVHSEFTYYDAPSFANGMLSFIE